LGRLGRLHEGEAALRRALRLARKDGNVTIELRAATSLARLLAPHARHDEAQRVLQQSLRDLGSDVDARERAVAVALLAELSARVPLARSRLLAPEDSSGAALPAAPALAAAAGAAH
jgi:hypothetical protein